MANILIVDDNPDIAFMIQEKIRSAIGGAIRIANNGEAGLKAIDDEPPDLIMLDIRMPGTDGFEVCRLLKASPTTAAIPVIFLSATFNDLRSKIKGLDLGADDFMVHPVDDLELVTRVKAILQIKELRDQLASLRQSMDGLRAQHGELQERLASTCGKVLRFCQTGAEEGLSVHELAEEARRQLAFVTASSNGEGTGPEQPPAGDGVCMAGRTA
jgi:DNA-binding response OmpR family regulator